jgi:hypothetical protein
MESYKGRNKELESPHLTLAEDSCWRGSYCICVIVGKTCEQVVDPDVVKTGHASVSSKSADCTHHIRT